MTRTRVAVVGVVIGLVLVAAAVIGLSRRGVVTGDPVALPAAAGRLPTAVAAGNPSAPGTVAAPPAPRPGARLLLPGLHLSAPIVHVGLAGTVMHVPRDPRRVGWWSGGVTPGSERGSAVIVGHVNYRGTSGVFAALPRLRPGDRVELTNPDHEFRVAAVRSYPKRDGLPAALFAQSGPAQLVLITCGGSFDPVTGNYRDNIVVVAAPA